MSDAANGRGHDFEGMLSDALKPVEPPEELAGFEARMAAAVSDLADRAEELSEGERLALNDPRRWLRPALALTAATLTGVAAGITLLGRRRRGAGSRIGSLGRRLRR